jgi:hypothetical protein
MYRRGRQRFVDFSAALTVADSAALIKAGKEPEQTDDPIYNKPMDPTVLEELRDDWLHRSFREIDDKIVQLYDERYTV